MKKNKNTTNSTITFVWKYLREEKKAFMLAIFFVMVNAGLQTLTPVAIEYVINNAIQKANYTLLWQISIGMCGLFLVEAGIFRQQVITVGHATQRIMYRIRTELFGHIQRLDSEFFTSNQSGDLISRINSDTTKLDDFLGQYIFSFTSQFFVFVAFGLYLFVLHPSLALIAYCGVFLTVILSLLIRPIVERTNTQSLENNGSIKSFLADNLNNYQVIQAYNIHTNLSKEFLGYNAQNRRANFMSRAFTNVFNPLYSLSGNASLLAILIAIFMFDFRSDIGGLVAFIYAVVKFFQPLRELGTVFAALAEAVSAVGRIRDILNKKISTLFQKDKKFKTKRFNSKSAIEFKNVSFAYSNNSQKVLDSISFSVPKNSKFAIIGPTGEGKSTIAKLMSGILKEDSGSIEIFGKTLKNWSQEEFYSTIGFILQDPFLFTGTVASNIVYGNPRYFKYNEQLVFESATKIQKTEQNETVILQLIHELSKDIKTHKLDRIIPNLDEFLATEVNNNSQNISQGQKQIINFIRVLLREPKILILDEATANLDTITEKYLQESLENLTNSVTQIVIAHRQNTIQDADIIMMVGGGKVVLEQNRGKSSNQ